jgi:hypothetical protein
MQAAAGTGDSSLDPGYRYSFLRSGNNSSILWYSTHRTFQENIGGTLENFEFRKDPG